MVRIGFIGTGNMAQALMKAILDKGISDNLGMICSDKDKEKLKKAAEELEVLVTEDNKVVAKKADVIFLAVKPQDVEDVLKDIKDVLDDKKIIVSIAAGVKIAKIEKIIGNRKIVRVMPNTACLVEEMAAGYSANKNLEEEEITTIEILLKTSGYAVRLEEGLLDAVTGLSGSGPAFVARLVEYFTEAGKENGLDNETAYKLALKTFEGSAKLLNKMQPEELVNIVSSPKGTTVAGREVLEKSDVKEVVKDTIKKAVERSKELGK
jgi:pyrroline-5-carboxylate reductase